MLNINEINYIKASHQFKDGKLLIDDKFFEKYGSRKINQLPDEIYVGISSDNIKLVSQISNEEKIKSLTKKIKVEAIDTFSDKKVIYGKTSNNEIITFYSLKSYCLNINYVVKISFNISDLDIFDKDHNPLTIKGEIAYPIIDILASKIHGDYYLLSNDKSLSKTKYFIVDDFFIAKIL